SRASTTSSPASSRSRAHPSGVGAGATLSDLQTTKAAVLRSSPFCFAGTPIAWPRWFRGAWTWCPHQTDIERTEMNRRQLGLGAALTAMASAAGMSVQAQTRDPSAVAFYNGFNDQLARLPEAIQGDVRAFYELNGW